MRVVDNQPRVVLLCKFEQAPKRGDIAVHAENRVGGDQLALRAARRESLFERLEVSVGIANEIGTRQKRRIVQTSVVQLVGEYGITAADERRDDGEVRQVSGRKQQCSRARARSDPRGKLALHRVVGREMPGDEVRRAGADAVSRSALLRCRDDAPLAGQA